MMPFSSEICFVGRLVGRSVWHSRSKGKVQTSMHKKREEIWKILCGDWGSAGLFRRFCHQIYWREEVARSLASIHSWKITGTCEEVIRTRVSIDRWRINARGNVCHKHHMTVPVATRRALLRLSLDFLFFLMTVHIKLLPWIDISQKFTAQVFRDCAPCSKNRKTLFALNGQLVIVRHWFMSTGRDAFLLSCFAFEFLTFVTLRKRSRQLSFYAFERSLYTAIKIVRIWKSVTGRSYIQRDSKKLDNLSRKILNLKELFFPSERFEVSTTCRVRLL